MYTWQPPYGSSVQSRTGHMLGHANPDFPSQKSFHVSKNRAFRELVPGIFWTKVPRLRYRPPWSISPKKLEKERAGHYPEIFFLNSNFSINFQSHFRKRERIDPQRCQVWNVTIQTGRFSTACIPRNFDLVIETPEIGPGTWIPEFGPRVVVSILALPKNVSIVIQT